MQDEAIKGASKKWEWATIMYVIGAKPSLPTVRSYVSKNWKGIADPAVYRHDEGYFVVNFASFSDQKKVMDAGPYFFYNKPIMLKPWSESYRFDEDVLKTMPLWVRLPNLPLHFWGLDSLSRIGSLLGTPLCADECTSNQLRVSFARLMVEVDVTKPLPKVVHISAKGQVYEQRVLYEWAPAFCVRCNKVGHNCDKPKQTGPVRRVWRPKASQPQQGNQAGGTQAQQQQQQGNNSGAVGSDKGPNVSNTPNAAEPSNAVVVTPVAVADPGWHTISRGSRGQGYGVRAREVNRRPVTPYPFSNSFMALIEEGENEGVDDGDGDASVEEGPPSGTLYLT